MRKAYGQKCADRGYPLVDCGVDYRAGEKPTVGNALTVPTCSSIDGCRLTRQSFGAGLTPLGTWRILTGNFHTLANLGAIVRDIRKVAVLGAGTMGARIAAHLANASVPCLLLDIIPKTVNARRASQRIGA